MCVTIFRPNDVYKNCYLATRQYGFFLGLLHICRFGYHNLCLCTCSKTINKSFNNPWMWLWAEANWVRFDQFLLLFYDFLYVHIFHQLLCCGLELCFSSVKDTIRTNLYDYKIFNLFWIRIVIYWRNKSQPFMFGNSGAIPVLLSQSHTPL